MMKLFVIFFNPFKVIHQKKKFNIANFLIFNYICMTLFWDYSHYCFNFAVIWIWPKSQKLIPGKWTEETKKKNFLQSILKLFWLDLSESFSPLR